MCFSIRADSIMISMNTPSPMFYMSAWVIHHSTSTAYNDTLHAHNYTYCTRSYAMATSMLRYFCKEVGCAPVQSRRSLHSPPPEVIVVLTIPALLRNFLSYFAILSFHLQSESSVSQLSSSGASFHLQRNSRRIWQPTPVVLRLKNILQL